MLDKLLEHDAAKKRMGRLKFDVTTIVKEAELDVEVRKEELEAVLTKLIER